MNKDFTSRKSASYLAFRDIGGNLTPRNIRRLMNKHANNPRLLGLLKEELSKYNCNQGE